MPDHTSYFWPQFAAVIVGTLFFTAVFVLVLILEVKKPLTLLSLMLLALFGWLSIGGWKLVPGYMMGLDRFPSMTLCTVSGDKSQWSDVRIYRDLDGWYNVCGRNEQNQIEDITYNPAYIHSLSTPKVEYVLNPLAVNK